MHKYLHLIAIIQTNHIDFTTFLSDDIVDSTKKDDKKDQKKQSIKHE